MTIPPPPDLYHAGGARSAARRAATQAEAARRERERKADAPLPAGLVPKIEDEEDIEHPLVQRREMPHDHIDMTPMVDITFLLLIFFMSTANFTLQKSLEVPVQKEQKASTRAVQVSNEDVQDSVTVQVDEHNAYLVLMPDGTDREASSKPDLIMALDEARAVANALPPEKLIIEAHRDCAHKAVVTALDAGRDKDFIKFQVNVVDEFE
ncbi:MAG: ExbD/TolR family protein [Aureliella sp.]